MDIEFDVMEYKDTTKTKKVKNSLKMLELLKKHGRMKSYEIADKLGLKSTRQIYFYRAFLAQLGYNIKSYGGYRNGGYELVIPEILSKEDLNFLESMLDSNLYNKIKKINEFVGG